jgi:hypothetical protein
LKEVRTERALAMRQKLATVLVVLTVALAGCSGAITDTGPADATPTSADGTGPDGGAASDAGTVNFYVSDEQNTIGDFEHLNVTVTKVGFHETDAGDDENETDDETNATATVTATSEANATQTMTATQTDETTTAETNETTTAQPATESDENESETDDEEAKGGEWVVQDVDNVTLDLTELQGDNATLVEQFEVPNGTYDKVFVHIGEVEGTLTSGEQVNVKLPSQKLHINEEFTVGANDSVDFVFDITVFKAGNSGKYILKPVVTESGTDVPIEEVGDDDDERDEAGEENGADENETEVENLSASLQGPVRVGENVTVKATADGPVANATVMVGDETVGTTAADGTLTFTVPDVEEELTVTVVAGDDEEVELEREVTGSGNGDGEQ